MHETGQPVLVGTRDVAESEELHERLVKAGVPAVVLNAKNDAEEAAVIAEAGTLGSVTVSTQMAGRGTDIRLGGSDEADHDEVAELGGLHVIGTGRHHTERLDNQLRGRAGRQGDPGSSVFFSSWEDDVVRRPPRAANKLPTETDEDGRIVSTKAAGLLDHAQRVAEGRLLDVHANTWRYNQLIAQQRAILVERRNTLLRTADRARGTREAVAGALRGAGRGAQRGAAGADLPADHALPPRPRLGRPPGLPRRHPGEHPPAGAGPARTRSTSSTGWPSTRSPRWPPTRSRPRSRPSRPPNVLEDEQGLDLSKLARPTSTWTYMVHDNPLADDSHVGAEPAGGVPLGLSP